MKSVLLLGIFLLAESLSCWAQASDAPAGGTSSDSGPQFGTVEKKGSLEITTLMEGLVTLFGKTVSLTPGTALPVANVNAGKVSIRMAYVDGTTEDRAVTVYSGKQTTVAFTKTPVMKVPVKEISLTGDAADFEGVKPLWLSDDPPAPGRLQSLTICRDEENVSALIQLPGGVPYQLNAGVGITLSQDNGQTVHDFKVISDRNSSFTPGELVISVPRSTVRLFRNSGRSRITGDFVEIQFPLSILGDTGLKYDLAHPIVIYWWWYAPTAGGSGKELNVLFGNTP